MKKSILTMTAVFMFFISGIALAEMKDKGMGMGGGMMKGDMMDKGGMMGGKMMEMCSMMQPTVVATSDGGVIILLGNTLTKYDKNLNVVKEVKIKMDMEGMGKMCPMMVKGMLGKKDMDVKEEAATDATEKSEHESHH